MKIDYFERKLRFKDLEVWDVRLENSTYRFIVLDENRPPKMDDLYLPDGMELEEDELRKNLITVKVYSTKYVKDKHIEVLDEFAKSITGHVAMAHCHVVTSFYESPLDEALNQVLLEKIGHEESEIPLQKLWHLNQD